MNTAMLSRVSGLLLSLAVLASTTPWTFGDDEPGTAKNDEEDTICTCLQWGLGPSETPGNYYYLAIAVSGTSCASGDVEYYATIAEGLDDHLPYVPYIPCSDNPATICGPCHDPSTPPTRALPAPVSSVKLHDLPADRSADHEFRATGYNVVGQTIRFLRVDMNNGSVKWFRLYSVDVTKGSSKELYTLRAGFQVKPPSPGSADPYYRLDEGSLENQKAFTNWKVATVQIGKTEYPVRMH